MWWKTSEDPACGEDDCFWNITVHLNLFFIISTIQSNVKQLFMQIIKIHHEVKRVISFFTIQYSFFVVFLDNIYYIIYIYMYIYNIYHIVSKCYFVMRTYQKFLFRFVEKNTFQKGRGTVRILDDSTCTCIHIGHGLSTVLVKIRQLLT